MMNFRKIVRKSGKRTCCFHGLSWKQRKQYKSNIDKKFFERPSDAFVSTVKISFQSEVAVHKLGIEARGGVTQPSLGSRGGSKTGVLQEKNDIYSPSGNEKCTIFSTEQLD